jgi:4-diphosphocytidyl-2-C-methyl-D-erythritol kinase
MVCFPPCKINLGLAIVGKRPDGYHDLITCFYPVPFQDILEIVPSKEFSFTGSGIPVVANPDSNLCVKAYRLLKNHADLPFVQMHLHKLIPAGAGLGGGSSDAAWTLRSLNQIFKLNISIERLKNFASELGSDCAFFIEDKPMTGTGRGDVLEPVGIDLSNKWLVLVKPSVHVSTAEAYANVKMRTPERDLREILHRPVREWKDHLKNDFEESVFNRYPMIKQTKQKMYDCGAEYASMSGSGSAVYGIFHEALDLRNQFPGMLYWAGQL